MTDGKPNPLIAYILICLGSALGGGLRFWISGMIAGRWGESFPTGTLLVNASGSFAIGLIAAISEADGRFLIGPAARQFWMIGVLGGYTTFSSFSLQTLHLLHDREWFYAAANVLVSVGLCLVMVWLGNTLGEFLNLRN